jgi:arylsulfatase A-like enzyme
LWSCLESPRDFAPKDLTADQVREINAMIHVENELIDEACGRVLDYVGTRGWSADTDVFFTTDHGELQGDFGLLFKGPYHVDGLLRLPFVWRPAPRERVPPARVDSPVGQVDLAQTFCHVAGVPEPPWAQGRRLPRDQTEAARQNRHHVLTEWESEHAGVSIRLRSIYRDGVLCTVYEPSSTYSGEEGELYRVEDDPMQRDNLWNDRGYAGLKRELRAALYGALPPARETQLTRVAPV